MEKYTTQYKNYANLIYCGFLMSLWLWPPLLLAGSFSINPVSLTLSAQKQSQVVSIRNESQQAAVMQVDLFSWKQINNQDQYTQTRDLLVTPPIFLIESGKSQIIRVGVRNFIANDREATYRMYINEVPQKAGSGQQHIAMVLRIGIPIFVVPEDPPHSNLLWRATPMQNAGFQISVSNAGNVHAKLSGFSLYLLGHETPLLQRNMFSYLLSASEHVWTYDANIDGSLRLIAETGNGQSIHDFMLDKSSLD